MVLASLQPQALLARPLSTPDPRRLIVLAGWFDLHGPATPASAVRGAGGTPTAWAAPPSQTRGRRSFLRLHLRHLDPYTHS